MHLYDSPLLPSRQIVPSAEGVRLEEVVVWSVVAGVRLEEVVVWSVVAGVVIALQM